MCATISNRRLRVEEQAEETVPVSSMPYVTTSIHEHVWLPYVIVECETWSSTKAEENLTVTKRAIKRWMLEVSLRNLVDNQTLRQTSVTRESKIFCAGHVARLTERSLDVAFHKVKSTRRTTLQGNHVFTWRRWRVANGDERLG